MRALHDSSIRLVEKSRIILVSWFSKMMDPSRFDRAILAFRCSYRCRCVRPDLVLSIGGRASKCGGSAALHDNCVYRWQCLVVKQARESARRQWLRGRCTSRRVSLLEGSPISRVPISMSSSLSVCL